MTMNDTWGYKSYDHNWKSTETLLRNLIDIASKGGNYLLNVGPTARGEIPGPSVERLAEMGKWLKANGDSIYGTSASPFKRYSFDGRATVKGNTLFLHVFKWPDKGIEIMGLKTPVKHANFLFDGSAATLARGESTESSTPTIIIAPPANQDPIATVVALELEGAPEVDATAIALRPDSSGMFKLAAGDADHLGDKLKMEEGHHGIAEEQADVAMWNILVPKAGTYQVEIEYGCEDNSAGSNYTISAGDEKVSGKIEATGGWKKYKTAKPGELKLGEGRQTVRLQASDLKGRAAMNLREIRLKT
jgi:alpha-L-fucosidase